ncbi:MAG: DUF481 domain-containing protein, partial [Pseudohongiellaceae bacterium]
MTFTSGAVLAQDEKDWDASISLGYVGTSGNTETQTFNTEALYTLQRSLWTHKLKFQGLGSSENGITKAERYYVEDKSDYDMGESHYVYAKGSYTDDRFSGFSYQASASAGYGRYFYNQDTFTLEGFGGLGYRQNDTIDAGSEGEVIFSLGENLVWQLNDTTSVTQNITTEIGDELTVTRLEVGLVSNIVDRIATKIAFQARNISEVPV